MFSFLSDFLGGNIALISSGLILLPTFIVGLFMALAVKEDAARIQRHPQQVLFLFSPVLWAWIVFLFSFAGLALYWAIHYSKLRREEPSPRPLLGANPSAGTKTSFKEAECDPTSSNADSVPY